MRIITVIPISRGISKDTLTYFTNREVPVGSIVSVPLRNKTTYGLVTASRQAQEIKSEIKSLSYSIKKVEKISARTFLSPAFIKACQKIADYNASSVGSVLSALIPKSILEGSDKLKPQGEPFGTKGFPLGTGGKFYETVLLQSEDDERYATYKSLIREEFAKGRSVFFCLPTTEDLLNAKSVLEKGIEKYTFVLHSGLGKKELLNLWQKIIDEEHPVLIIGTGSFLSLPKNNLGTIVLEKESSRAYKMQTRPFLDVRGVAEAVARELNIRLVLGDIFLRTETLWQEKNGAYAELSPLKFRSLSTANCQIINMKTPQDMKKKEFKIFDDKLKDLIKEGKEKNEHTFLFCGRKGLYPITVCSDCGTVVVCKNCKAPVVLYGPFDKLRADKPASSKPSRSSGNLFVCNHCGERRDAGELCIHCGGWRLNTLGVGIERVVQEIKSTFPEIGLFIMDKDNISTHRQAVKVRDAFYNTAGAVMVGTEMALSYLNQKVENSAVVSIDSYFSIPDFQINEKIFHILLGLRAISEKNLIFQTRQENTKVFDYAMRGNLIDFYRDEIAERESIGYPPFTTYIKITLEGEKGVTKKQMEETVEFMRPYTLTVFEAFIAGSKNKYTVNALISLPQGKWVDKILLEKLRQLPPQYVIKIDPATLL